MQTLSIEEAEHVMHSGRGESIKDEAGVANRVRTEVVKACAEVLNQPGLRKDFMSNSVELRDCLRRLILEQLQGNWNAVSPGFLKRPSMKELPDDFLWWEITVPSGSVIRIADHALSDTAEIRDVFA